MTVRTTTKHDIQIDDENTTRPSFATVTKILITGSMWMNYLGVDPGTGPVTIFISGSGVTNGDAHTHLSGSGAPITASQVGAIPTDGWMLVSDVWTRTSNISFSVPGHKDTTYRKGTKVRWKNGGAYSYGVIESSSNVGGPIITNINLISNSDYAMSAGPTDTWISFVENPEGFPQWFNWAATPLGFSATPTADYRWMVVNNTIHINYDESANGTSNATTFTATAPTAPLYNVAVPLGLTVDNGTTQTSPGKVAINAGSTTMTFRKDMATGAWTNPGGKRAVAHFFYEF